MIFPLFLVTSTSEHHSRPDPKCGKVEGEANLLWTQWTHVDLDGKGDEWGENEQRGVMYMASQSGAAQPNRYFPCSSNPKANGQ